MIMGALNSTCNVKCQISVWLGTEGYPLQAKHSEQCSTILLCRRWYAQYTSGLECLRCSVRTANRPGVLNGHLSAAIGEEVEGGGVHLRRKLPTMHIRDVVKMWTNESFSASKLGVEKKR